MKGKRQKGEKGEKGRRKRREESFFNILVSTYGQGPYGPGPSGPYGPGPLIILKNILS